MTSRRHDAVRDAMVPLGRVAASGRSLRTRRPGRVRHLGILMATAVFASAPLAVAAPFDPNDSTPDLRTVSVRVSLRTGGALEGAVVEHTDHGLVIWRESVPYAIAWSDVEPASALTARRDVLALARGGLDRLTGQDCFDLGAFCLKLGRNDLAAREFAEARRLDPKLDGAIKAAYAAFRKEREAEKKKRGAPPFRGGREPEPFEPAPRAAASTVPVDLVGLDVHASSPADEKALRGRVLAVYHTFGAKVRDELGADIESVETEHFLIWTDWERVFRAELAESLENMFDSLRRRFSMDESQPVFLAKCPVFVFRSKKRFIEFARRFDGYDATGSLGYTRSIESNGHAHMALLRSGHAPDDFDRFYCTLVHEGTHAFLHRAFSTRLIPHWVNEGLADLSADHVLGDVCHRRADANLLARAYVRNDWPIETFLSFAGPIGVEHYPLACGVMDMLEQRNRDGLVDMVRRLKAGESIEASLAGAFGGATPQTVESEWRQRVRQMNPDLHAPSPAEGEPQGAAPR